jgi:hypothetical protein
MLNKAESGVAVSDLMGGKTQERRSVTELICTLLQTTLGAV